MPQLYWLDIFDENYYRNMLKSISVTLIIQGNFWCVKILSNQSHNCPTQNRIAATIPLPESSFSTINPNIVNSQHSQSCMNMTNVITKWTKHWKESQNLSKKLQIITNLSTLHSARKIPTHNANPLTIVKPEHSIPTTTILQQGGCLNGCYWPESLQWEDSQCDRARVAKPHCHQQQRFAWNWQIDHEHSLGWLQGIAAV